MAETRPTSPISRRDALRGAAIGAGAIALARPAAALAQSSGFDPSEALFDATEIARALPVVYAEASNQKQPKADATALVRLGVQSDAQAEALENAFELGSADEPPETPTALDESDLTSDLGGSPSLDDLLGRAIELEARLITVLLDGAPDVESPSLVRTFGEIVSSSAQHQAIVREIQGEAPADVVPDAIVEPLPPDSATTPPEDSASQDSGS
ncbi:hypothetical protein HJD18_01555 [Thermoleophilia bacterium SCSIO 60948]|nr:hypothetical protein HJD18_01555 [Thermoleophilia bacterium SCSIO 60948]